MKKTVTALKSDCDVTTNSGLIIDNIGREILTVKAPWDFSDFPKYGEKINGLILSNPSVLTMNNFGAIYHSVDNLHSLGIERLEDLMGKYVVYDKITDVGKHYFGETSDYGQRATEHSLTNKSGVLEHYADFRKYGRCFIRILAVRNTFEYAKRIEDMYIAEFVKKVFSEIYPTAHINNFSKAEIAEMVSSALYNKKLPDEIYI